jgi:hypothetical protein
VADAPARAVGAHSYPVAAIVPAAETALVAVVVEPSCQGDAPVARHRCLACAREGAAPVRNGRVADPEAEVAQAVAAAERSGVQATAAPADGPAASTAAFTSGPIG